MTARLCRPSFHPHPLSIHFKSAHRATADVRVGRGNHEAFGPGLVALRGWYPIEVLHFPVRSLAHCLQKYVTQFVALERNAEKGIPDHMASAYRAYREGRLAAFYEPLVVDDAALEQGVANGELALDTRLRGRLAALGFGAGAGTGPPIGAAATEAGFAGEFSVLADADVGLAYSARVDDFERRLARLGWLA
jgi:hypothetical protein